MFVKVIIRLLLCDLIPIHFSSRERHKKLEKKNNEVYQETLVLEKKNRNIVLSVDKQEVNMQVE